MLLRPVFKRLFQGSESFVFNSNVCFVAVSELELSELMIIYCDTFLFQFKQKRKIMLGYSQNAFEINVVEF